MREYCFMIFSILSFSYRTTGWEGFSRHSGFSTQTAQLCLNLQLAKKVISGLEDMNILTAVQWSSKQIKYKSLMDKSTACGTYLLKSNLF